jgi:diguanylate cyclase (GGDEF)-like protein
MPASQTVSPRTRPFRVARFFSTASLIGILIVTACLIWTYRELTLQNLIEHETRSNVDLTRAFSNDLWGRYGAFVLGTGGRKREALLTDPAQDLLRAEVQQKMKGLKIVKLKVYNADGLTVYSTDERQIGEDKSANPAFRLALAGEVTSDITFRDTFDTYEGKLANRNLIFSYIPVRAVADGPPVAVFEIYSDVTDLLGRQTRAQWQVAAVVLSSLAGLYLFLYVVVLKADRIIARQEKERSLREEQIRHQAHHDALTGLPNRTYFSTRLNEALAHARRYGHMGALMFIDLDRFKIVNDSLGHNAGDQLLQVVAQRIGNCVRDTDLLFRMGGDEFVVILPEMAEPEDAAHLAQRIIAGVSAPVSLYEHEVSVGATIGIAVYPGDGDDAEEVMRNADAAMYSAKQAGRGTHAFYRHDMNDHALERLGLEEELKQAFRNGEFLLHYQPRLDAATRRIVALEALMRWNSPKRGLVMPKDFIGALEDAGMMQLVGEWVLRTACAQQHRWTEAGRAPLRISVNVSARQFQNPSFAATVARVIEETGVAPDCVELELTESLLITRPDEARTTIAALKALGVRTAIDDFGTGYSSLSYLRHFAVGCLKIDRSFVSEVASSTRDQSVARAIIELAKALGIEVVAEGVETDAQAAFFAAAGCNELQGFLFCEPRPSDQLDEYLNAGSPPYPMAWIAGSRARATVPPESKKANPEELA